MRDLYNSIKAVIAIAPVTITDNTGPTGIIIDRQGFDSVTFVFATGTLADADIAAGVSLKHGDVANLSDEDTVDDVDMIPETAVNPTVLLGPTDDAKTIKFAYLGQKRYLRLDINVSNNTGSFPMAAIAILGHPTQLPQSTQKL